MQRHSVFTFSGYEYDNMARVATFRYNVDNTYQFAERVTFSGSQNTDSAVFTRALELAYVLAGVSYYKTFISEVIDTGELELDEFQAQFFTETYLHGLSQFVYENYLSPNTVATFSAINARVATQPYQGGGVTVLQSGGKDSLLLAELLKKNGQSFDALHITPNAKRHPAVLDSMGRPLRIIERSLDGEGLKKAHAAGALNGHVPVTYITLAYALVDAILNNHNTVLAAIGHEGEEPHAFIGEYPVTHQWSKTWRAEQLFAEYVRRCISPDIVVGSPLRSMSELKITELFAEHGWQRYSHAFSSCNVANYMQDHDNTTLSWCANCPKCANAYLLFSAYIAPNELIDTFGSDLYSDPSLRETFMGLLGINDVEKPFECVGEIGELRRAYHMAKVRGYSRLPFEVPASEFAVDTTYEHQPELLEMIQS